MAAKRTDPERTAEPTDQHRLELIIGERVLGLLGRPVALHRIRVHRLWEDRYRVNVLIGVEAAFADIAHSYFLTTDGEGNILESSPVIRKLY